MFLKQVLGKYYMSHIMRKPVLCYMWTIKAQSGSALIAQVYLSKNLGSLQYFDGIWPPFSHKNFWGHLLEKRHAIRKDMIFLFQWMTLKIRHIVQTTFFGDLLGITVKSEKFGHLKIAVIILKFGQCDFTIEWCRRNGKQCSWSDCSFIWVYTVCLDLSVQNLGPLR